MGRGARAHVARLDPKARNAPTQISQAALVQIVTSIAQDEERSERCRGKAATSRKSVRLFKWLTRPAVQLDSMEHLEAVLNIARVEQTCTAQERLISRRRRPILPS